MENSFETGTVRSFFISAMENATVATSPERKTEPHIHDFCEIYVNVAGNVSFVVEKSIYAVQAGDIIVTKPYEYHHCVYHDESDHLHFLINFSPNENPELFSFLLEKRAGASNHIRLSAEKSEKLLSLCRGLANPDGTRLGHMATFLKLLSYVDEGVTHYAVTSSASDIPTSLQDILSFINKSYASIATVGEIAERFFISISTLERYFKKYLSMTPKRYLEDKKLQRACILLKEGYSVLDACLESGFSDYSHFIAIFKRKFKVTPMKYKKSV